MILSRRGEFLIFPGWILFHPSLFDTEEKGGGCTGPRVDPFLRFASAALSGNDDHLGSRGILEGVVGNDLKTLGGDGFLRVGNGVQVEGHDHVVAAAPRPTLGGEHGIAKNFPGPCEIDQSGLIGNDERDALQYVSRMVTTGVLNNELTTNSETDLVSFLSAILSTKTDQRFSLE
jgi:hypothetical protein